MGGVKCRKSAADRVNDIGQAKCADLTGDVTSIHAADSTYGIP
jgi:hypothetical protein